MAPETVSRASARHLFGGVFPAEFSFAGSGKHATKCYVFGVFSQPSPGGIIDRIAIIN